MDLGALRRVPLGVAAVTADALVALLAAKHSGDVFVPECKDGPTQTRAHLRLDAWVLLKTWSPITAIGYEVKVTRSDWRRDEKMHNYMPLCHLLYVVAPKGVVPREELPAGVGLMEPHGERLLTRVKAARREVPLPSELMVYVLMCRAKIGADVNDPRHGFDARAWRVRELRAWVEGREERVKMSHAVSERIREAFNAQERERRDHENKLQELAAVRERIRELGFDENQSIYRWQVSEKLAAFNATVSDHVLRDMDTAAKLLERTAAQLRQMKERKADTET